MFVRRTAVITALAVVVLAVPLSATAADPPPPESVYRVQGVDTPGERTAVSRQDVDVLGSGPDHLEVRATPEEARRLREAGLTLVPLLPTAGAPTAGAPTAGDFPAGFTGYHTYAELTTELAALAGQHPDVVALSGYGQSFEGRELPLVKISDAVRADEDEPEVLFTCGQHGREHLTVEMCLHIVQRMADGHGTDPAVTELVSSREIWVMPMTNPDGAEYDIADGSFAYWRKNRQPNPGTSEIGTDLNRNWGTRWGCCGGSSSDPGSDVYRGSAPFSAPETAHLRNWVNSRVLGGEQQITAHIDFHTFSELVLWPYGYTTADTAPGLGSTDAAAFRTLGQAMADTNGYTPQQSSDIYINDGSIGDWMWAQHGIWSFTFEMYPTGELQGGFYPPDTVIKREAERNDTAVDLLLRSADCVRCLALP